MMYRLDTTTRLIFLDIKSYGSIFEDLHSIRWVKILIGTFGIERHAHRDGMQGYYHHHHEQYSYSSFHSAPGTCTTRSRSPKSRECAHFQLLSNGTSVVIL